MGILVFSPFGSFLVMDVLGLPMSLPELLFIPFFIIYRKRYQFSPIGGVRAFIFFTLWVIMLSISILVKEYSTSAVISSSRTYLTLIISYLFFSRENNVSLDDVMYISLGSTIGWLISSFIGISVYLSGQAPTVARCGNMLALVLLISIAMFRRHNKVLLFSIFLCTLLSLTSGMRRQIVVFLASLLLSYLLLSIKNVNKFLQYTLLLTLAIVLFLIFLPRIEDYLKTSAPQLYFRIFQKTEMFLTGKSEKSGDLVRIKIMSNMVQNFGDYIIPKGFVSRRTATDNTGRFIDFPLSELFYTFGFFSIFILLGIIICTIGCFYQYFNWRSDSAIFVVVALIMLMLLFIEGTFLSSSYVTPFTGYCLGSLKRYSRISFFKFPKFV